MRVKHLKLLALVLVIGLVIGYFAMNPPQTSSNNKHLDVGLAIHLKNGKTVYPSKPSWFQSVFYNYQGVEYEVQSISLVPVLKFWYTGDLKDAQAHAVVHVYVGTSPEQPLNSMVEWSGVFKSDTWHLISSGWGKNAKIGQNANGYPYVVWNLEPVNISANELEMIVQSTFGSDYNGQVTFVFNFTVYVHAIFKGGQQDSKTYYGIGQITLKIDPDGQLLTGVVDINYNWQETDPSTGSGGNSNTPIKPYSIF